MPAASEHEEQLRKRREKYAETRDNDGTREKIGQGWSDRRILFLLIFVTLVSVLLGFRSEVNAHDIKRQQDRQDAVAVDLQKRIHARTVLDYRACLVRVRQLDAQAEFARESYAEELAGPTPVGTGGAKLKAARLTSAKKLLAASQHADCIKP